MKENYLEDPSRCPPDLLKGFVYLVKCKQYYKIGYTKRLGVRMVALKIGNPFPIDLIYSVEVSDAENLEGLLHRGFEEYLHKGEWFIFPKNVIQLVINSMNNYGK